MDRAADITTIGPPEISNGARRLLPPPPTHDLIDAITSGAIAHHAAITPRGAAPTSLHSPLQSVQQAATFMADSSRFGFVAFAETWNGRLAMLGFVIGLATELLTGQGVLAQIGLG